MNGYIYILSNPSMLGLVKIGKTMTTPSRRMSDLQSTGVPTPFELEFAVEVADCHSSERAAHGALAQHRVSENREFFKISPQRAVEGILPILSAYKLYSAKEAHGIEKIEIEIKRRHEEMQAELMRRSDELKRKEALEQSRLQRESEIKAHRHSYITDIATNLTTISKPVNELINSYYDDYNRQDKMRTIVSAASLIGGMVLPFLLPICIIINKSDDKIGLKFGNKIINKDRNDSKNHTLEIKRLTELIIELSKKDIFEDVLNAHRQQLAAMGMRTLIFGNRYDGSDDRRTGFSLLFSGILDKLGIKRAGP